jgi:hypothetical protein
MAIRISADGIERVSKHLTEFPEKIAHPVILELSQVIYDGVQAGADAHTKTDALFQSVYNRAIPGGREVGHDTRRAPHAVFVLFGTRPHEIRPKGKKALRWPGGGGFIFAKWVKHPGYEGDQYMHRAVQRALSGMEAIIARHVKKYEV